MKSALLATLLFVVTTVAFGASDLPSPQNPVAVAQWLTSLGARREGSADESKVFSALRSWFSGRIDLKSRDFSHLEGEHSFSQQLWFRVGGPRAGDLVVMVPTDGSNNQGLAWAVAWADEALSRGTSVSVTFVFSGAERQSARGLGSRTFLEDFYPSGASAVVYLDTTAPADTCRLVTESGAYPSPLWMVKNLSRALEAQGLAVQFAGSAPSLFRLDWESRQNALAPWFDRGIPGIWVAAGPNTQAPVEALRAFSSASEQGVPNEWDRHYLAFELGPLLWFWGQDAYLALFLALAAILLFGYALLGRPRRGSFRIVGSSWWQLPVLLSFAFLALWVATAATQYLQEWRGEPDYWRRAPLLVAALKGTGALALYLGTFVFLRRAPLSRNPDFYGQAALVCLGVMTVTAAAIELSFSFYFLWALIFCAVMLVSPWRPVQAVALLLGPLWLFKAAYDVLGPASDADLTRWALVSPVAGNGVVALLVFPFLLQLHAWHYGGSRFQERNEDLRAALRVGLFFFAAGTLALVVLRDAPPVRPDHLEPVRPEEQWSTQTRHEAFLNRTVWTVSMASSREVASLDLVLTSDAGLVVYDCNFPVVLEPNGHRARIVVGRQPPFPLEVTLTLPVATVAHLEAVVVGEGVPAFTLQPTWELRP